MNQNPDPKRATGRTLGRMLQALGKAVENPGTDVEFINHNPQNHGQHQMCKRHIESLAKLLHLDVSVDIKLNENLADYGVFVKSNWVSPYAQRASVEEAFKEVYGYYPECFNTSVWIAFQKGFEAAQK